MAMSRISQHSRSISQILHDPFELTDEELIKLVFENKQQIRYLTIENEILEKTIMRLDPSLMTSVAQAIDLATKLSSNSSITLGGVSRSHVSKNIIGDSATTTSKLMLSPSRISARKVESSAKFGGTVVFGSGPRVNILERSELVTAEIEIVIRDLEKSRRRAATKQSYLKAQLEEVGLRVTDIEKAAKMFQQDVIVEGWDKIAQRIPAEIWIRFMTEWVKITDSQIGKLRLRTSTLNTQFSKLKGQIRTKTELSESLRPVDFEKLEIENGECEQIIEQKLQQLTGLKKMTGDANLDLTIHKKAMMEQNAYLTTIQDTIKQREHQTVQLDKERDCIAIQADDLATKLDEVRKVRLAYEVPDVMDYVRIKAQITDLKHSIKMLDNRLHIQLIAIASLNKKIHDKMCNVMLKEE